MNDQIHPQLLERVERSLRKRLKTNVLPHLLRCAAHAKSEDDFMAAAARLLLNPQERRAWLASWATRRHQISQDTTPAHLDSAPVALDDLVPHRFRITPSQRERLREALARELGPIAPLLLDNEEKVASTVSDLLMRLETHLESDEQRTRFRQSTLSSHL